MVHYHAFRSGDLPDFSRAACRDEPLELFFSPDRGLKGNGSWSADPARRICHRCPERTACLGYAMDNKWVVGVWGGMTQIEREAERVRRRKAEAA